VVEATGAKLTDPKIEQRQISQDAIEQLGGKSAIRWREFAGLQELAEDYVGKFSSAAPLAEGGQSESA